MTKLLVRTLVLVLFLVGISFAQPRKVLDIDYVKVYMDSGMVTTGSASSPPSAITYIIKNSWDVPVRKFSGTATEDIKIQFQLPDDLASATVKFKVVGFVTESTAPSSEGLAFTLAGATIGDAAVPPASAGSAITVSVTGRSDAQYTKIETGWSDSVIITGIGSGETFFANFTRDHDHADDDYEQDFGVYMVYVQIGRAI